MAAEAAQLGPGLCAKINYEEVGEIQVHWEKKQGAIPAECCENTTLEMEHTLPAHIVPYVGKYEVENTTPDALQTQRIMAAMVDRGGEALVMESSTLMTRLPTSLSRRQRGEGFEF